MFIARHYVRVGGKMYKPGDEIPTAAMSDKAWKHLYEKKAITGSPDPVEAVLDNGEDEEAPDPEADRKTPHPAQSATIPSEVPKPNAASGGKSGAEETSETSGVSKPPPYGGRGKATAATIEPSGKATDGPEVAETDALANPQYAILEKESQTREGAQEKEAGGKKPAQKKAGEGSKSAADKKRGGKGSGKAAEQVEQEPALPMIDAGAMVVEKAEGGSKT